MKTYVVDIETSSNCDLGECGVFNYAHHPSTEILCCAYADLKGGEPEIWRCDSGSPIDELFGLLLSADLLIAHNANFERTVLGAFCPRLKEARRWADSAMLSGVAGRPHSLRDACRGLCFPESLEKDARGKRLLNMFSIRSSKLYVGGHDKDPAAFDELCEYCRQDVRAERAVWDALTTAEFGTYYTEDVRKQWFVDARIEDTGIPVDSKELAGAKALFEHFQTAAEAQALDLTGGVPLRSTVGLREWTAENGYALDSFSRTAVDGALADTAACDAAPKVERLLRLRKAVAGTAGKKFDTFINQTCADSRVRGSLDSRVATTGRYAGRGIQPQNLPRGFIDPALVPFVRDAAYMAASDGVGQAAAYLSLIADGAEVDALASLCRDSICAPEGKSFVVADYSAVEARVLAWLSGERWVEDIFRGDGKIYERTAAAMYKKDVASITKHERMAGKIATLALGYGGGVCALHRFAAAYGVEFTDEQAQDVVNAWRSSRPRTVGLWRMLDAALRKVVIGGQQEAYFSAGGRVCSFVASKVAGRPVVLMRLPSGRRITYWDPTVDAENGEICVEVYKTLCTKGSAKAKGAGTSRIYGGYLTENLTQAVAFDLLLNALCTLHHRPDVLQVVMHIHDEVVVECREAFAEKVAEIVKSAMENAPPWANGLPLKAEPEIMKRYKK